jgi:hypothetical protein
MNINYLNQINTYIFKFGTLQIPAAFLLKDLKEKETSVNVMQILLLCCS